MKQKSQFNSSVPQLPTPVVVAPKPRIVTSAATIFPSPMRSTGNLQPRPVSVLHLSARAPLSEHSLYLIVI